MSSTMPLVTPEYFLRLFSIGTVFVGHQSKKKYDFIPLRSGFHGCKKNSLANKLGLSYFMHNLSSLFL